MMIRIEINTDGDAFVPHPHGEVSRILRELSLDIAVMTLNHPRGQVCDSGEAWGDGIKLFDVNGNKCGSLRAGA